MSEKVDSTFSDRHSRRMRVVKEALGKPLERYFPGLLKTVEQHLGKWGGFNADEEADVDEVEKLVGSLTDIADFATDGLLKLKTDKDWEMPPASIVRPLWKTDFLKEGEQVLGYLKEGGEKRRYLVYSTFRREPEMYSDLTVLFQMLQPGEDTGPNEVHCRFGGKGEQPSVVAQGLEVYRVLAGSVEIEVDEKTNKVGPGEEFDTVVIPPGSRHKVVNSPGKRSNMLIVMGGGSARGLKIGEDGTIEVKEGIRVSPPEVPAQFKRMERFRKSGNEENKD